MFKLVVSQNEYEDFKHGLKGKRYLSIEETFSFERFPAIIHIEFKEKDKAHIEQLSPALIDSYMHIMEDFWK